MSGAAGALIAKSTNVFESVTSISASAATGTPTIKIGNHSDASTTVADTALVASAHDASSTGLVTLVDSTQDLGGAFITIKEGKNGVDTDGAFTINATDLAGNAVVEVITGGAQGFGFDIAKRFLESGANVIIWDIDEKELLKASKEIDNSNTVLWNGPAGYFENPSFAKGSIEISKKIVEIRISSLSYYLKRMVYFRVLPDRRTY